MSKYFKNFKTLKVLQKEHSNKLVLAESKLQIPGMPEQFLIKKFYNRSAVPQESLIHKELYDKNKRILAYYKDWFDYPFFYMSFEYCAGGSLEEFIAGLNGSSLPYFDIITWCHQLAENLQFFHNSQICHRQIKLENIFITLEGSLKIGNFEYAQKIENAQENAGIVHKRKLDLKRAEGKALYSKLDKSSPFKDDIWTLGKVMLELAMGNSCHELLSNKFAVDRLVIEKINQLSFPISFKELLKDMMSVGSKDLASMDEVVPLFSELLSQAINFSNELPGQLFELGSKDLKSSMSEEEIKQTSRESIKIHYELNSIHSEDLLFSSWDAKFIEDMKKKSISYSVEEETYYYNDEKTESNDFRSSSYISEEQKIPDDLNCLSNRASGIIGKLSSYSEKDRQGIPICDQQPANSSILKIETLSNLENLIIQRKNSELKKVNHRRSRSELAKNKCCICEKYIKDSEIITECMHYFHNYCFSNAYNSILAEAQKKVSSLDCVRCNQKVAFETFCLCLYLSNKAYSNAYLQLFAHTTCICPFCGSITDTCMLNDKLSFYSVTCKACNKKFCSFCDAENSHGWKSAWSCKYLKKLKNCNFVI